MTPQPARGPHRTWGEAAMNVATHPRLFFRWLIGILVVVGGLLLTFDEDFRRFVLALIGIAIVIIVVTLMVFGRNPIKVGKKKD